MKGDRESRAIAPVDEAGREDRGDLWVWCYPSAPGGGGDWHLACDYSARATLVRFLSALLKSPPGCSALIPLTDSRPDAARLTGRQCYPAWAQSLEITRALHEDGWEIRAMGGGYPAVFITAGGRWLKAWIHSITTDGEKGALIGNGQPGLWWWPYTEG